MTWPKSICPKCKTEYYGWAFGNPGCYVCSKCGSKLIVEDGSKAALNEHNNTGKETFIQEQPFQNEDFYMEPCQGSDEVDDTVLAAFSLGSGLADSTLESDDSRAG